MWTMSRDAEIYRKISSRRAHKFTLFTPLLVVDDRALDVFIR